MGDVQPQSWIPTMGWDMMGLIRFDGWEGYVGKIERQMVLELGVSDSNIESLARGSPWWGDRQDVASGNVQCSTLGPSLVEGSRFHIREVKRRRMAKLLIKTWMKPKKERETYSLDSQRAFERCGCHSQFAAFALLIGTRQRTQGLAASNTNFSGSGTARAVSVTGICNSQHSAFTRFCCVMGQCQPECCGPTEGPMHGDLATSLVTSCNSWARIAFVKSTHQQPSHCYNIHWVQ